LSSRGQELLIVSATHGGVKRVAVRPARHYNPTRMFVHIVLWRIKESGDGNTKQANALELKRRFEAMRGVISGMMRCDVGIDVSRGEESADVSLYSEFESKAALDAYAAHQAHIDIVTLIRTFKVERRVVDYEL